MNINITQINRLQSIQNDLARAVTKTPKHPPHHSCSKKLHFLKLPERIRTQTNSLESSPPSYLRQLFTIQQPRSTLSSSSLTLLRSSATKICQSLHSHSCTASLEQTPASIATKFNICPIQRTHQNFTSFYLSTALSSIHPLIHGLSARWCPMSPHFLTR